FDRIEGEEKEWLRYVTYAFTQDSFASEPANRGSATSRTMNTCRPTDWSWRALAISPVKVPRVHLWICSNTTPLSMVKPPAAKNGHSVAALGIIRTPSSAVDAQRRGRCARSRACRPRDCHRFTLDVCRRASIRRSGACSPGVEPSANGALGDISLGPIDKHE